MVKIINVVFIFNLFLFTISCKKSEFENSKSNYFENGIIKEHRQWNDKNSDEEYVQFNNKGDTILMVKTSGTHRAMVENNNDTIMFLFYLFEADSSRYILNEFFYMKDKMILTGMGCSYVFVKEVNDSISFICNHENLLNFKVFLIDRKDSLNFKQDTISLKLGTNEILISKKRISESYVIAYIEELFDKNIDGSYSYLVYNFFINPVKHMEFQEYFGIREEFFKQ